MPPSRKPICEVTRAEHDLVTVTIVGELDMARECELLNLAVTLVPGRQDVTQTTLVREELPVGEALAIAVRHRPDLQSARTLLAATRADKGAVAWGASSACSSRCPSAARSRSAGTSSRVRRSASS